MSLKAPREPLAHNGSRIARGERSDFEDSGVNMAATLEHVLSGNWGAPKILTEGELLATDWRV
jgi:hypothetical protein